MRTAGILAALMLAANVGYAEDGHDHERGAGTHVSPAASDEAVLVERNHAVIQVNGIVCSFCAYGAEKSLAELASLDRSQFGDGVLIDIETHRITLALRSGEKIPLRDAYRRIKKAGYDPTTVYLRTAGTLKRRDETLLLHSSTGNQVFLIAGGYIDGVSDDATVEVLAHVDAGQIPSLGETDPVELVVDRVISATERRRND